TTTWVMLSSANDSAGPRSKSSSPAAPPSTAVPMTWPASLTRASRHGPARPPAGTGGRAGRRGSQLLFDPWHAQLRLHDALDVLGDLGEGDAAHHLVQEACHQHVLGHLGPQAAAHEVEALVV